MECKVANPCAYILIRYTRINRNIVECKDIRRIYVHGNESVLIETLWNVKKAKANNYIVGSYGINRNIVECKDARHRKSLLDEHCINRNIVECKVSACEVTIGAMSAVLIETLWNVKQDQDYFLSSSE